ncbi:arrestin domain-containing protein [Lichtheimia corymbifera JMRC:FSU:9682]|uniref:Arrestin domain-containing protein n=1 Tax=Lichtheimia corymbifera JMRC:FSU:9682 TaxID=1263082 RepID=A0A068RI35_9FUNG|nr:arrestin domain-containing protein [Lichtheimia corymbifera JMRC:FSU:9682]
MQLVHGPEFTINLENDHVILHGTVDESAGVILRGTVILNCHENTKIKSIILKFQGKTKVNWVEGHGSSQRHFKEERTVIEHSWNFLEPKRKTYHLAVGRYKWDFELPLPGDLPSTVQHDLGQVYYRLKAVAERPAFSINYVAKRNIRVSRVMLPSSLELNQSVVISNEWTNKLAYNISVPRMVFSCGSTIPVSFDLIPTAPGLSVRAISCTLKEYITLTSHEHTRSEGRVIKTVRDEQFAPSMDRWTRTEILQVPNEHQGRIQSDTTSELIKIKHKLKFTVSLINGDGHISELRAAVPIIIAAVAPDEDANQLPAYEDAWKTLPYDTRTIEGMIASGNLPQSVAIAIPNAAANRIQEIPDSANNSGDEGEQQQQQHQQQPLPWEGFDLSRVPSYTTAVRSGRLYSFSGSLPTYESIAIPGTTA